MVLREIFKVLWIYPVDPIRQRAVELYVYIFGFSSDPIDTIIVATGILHSENFGPEKSIKEIDFTTMTKVMGVNTIGPALIGRYFIPLLRKDAKSVLAFLSARVGSISDNKLGGWYSYRASKTALNQIIKNFSIELKRTNPMLNIQKAHLSILEIKDVNVMPSF